ncbi:MAG: hypothetical protein R3B89_24735 [Polyangiaceae bacterium]
MNMTLRPAYALAFLAILVGVPLLTFGPWWAGLLVLAPAGYVLQREFRADRLVASLFSALVLGLLAAVYVAILVLFGFGGDWMVPVVLALLVGGVVAAMVSWVKARRAPPGLPDILGDEFGQDGLLETNEVQWVAMKSAEWLDRSSGVDVWLQSCVEAPRRCRLSFEEESRKPSGEGLLLFPPPSEVELAPGEVVRCHVPVRPTDRHADEIRFYVKLEAKGPVASRNRRFRGRPVEDRVSTGTQVIALAAGMVVWGGGVYVTFKRRIDQPAAWYAQLEITREGVWVPGVDQAAAVVSE